MPYIMIFFQPDYTLMNKYILSFTNQKGLKSYLVLNRDFTTYILVGNVNDATRFDDVSQAMGASVTCKCPQAQHEPFNYFENQEAAL